MVVDGLPPFHAYEKGWSNIRIDGPVSDYRFVISRPEMKKCRPGATMEAADGRYCRATTGSFSFRHSLAALLQVREQYLGVCKIKLGNRSEITDVERTAASE